MAKQSFSIDYWENDGNGEIGVSVDKDGKSYYDTYKFDATKSDEDVIKGLDDWLTEFGKKFEQPKQETLEDKVKRLEAENAQLKKKVAAQPATKKSVNDYPYAKPAYADADTNDKYFEDYLTKIFKDIL